METKTCTKCNEEKELSQFSKDKKASDGLYSICKSCSRAKSAAYAAENRENIRARRNTTPRGRYVTYKNGAKARNISFDLSFDQFMEFWQADCSYCGRPIPTIGLDRIDSSKGYELDNVVSCCARCNRMKMDSTTEDWYSDMLAVLKHQGII
jgi:hypothetical protein